MFARRGGLDKFVARGTAISIVNIGRLYIKIVNLRPVVLIASTCVARFHRSLQERDREKRDRKLRDREK